MSEKNNRPTPNSCSYLQHHYISVIFVYLGVKVDDLLLSHQLLHAIGLHYVSVASFYFRKQCPIIQEILFNSISTQFIKKWQPEG